MMFRLWPIFSGSLRYFLKEERLGKINLVAEGFLYEEPLNMLTSPGSCMFRSSVYSQNDRGTTELESNHRSSDFAQWFGIVQNLPKTPDHGMANVNVCKAQKQNESVDDQMYAWFVFLMTRQSFEDWRPNG